MSTARYRREPKHHEHGTDHSRDPKGGGVNDVAADYETGYKREPRGNSRTRCCVTRRSALDPWSRVHAVMHVPSQYPGVFQHFLQSNRVDPQVHGLRRLQLKQRFSVARNRTLLRREVAPGAAMRCSAACECRDFDDFARMGIETGG